ncbi:hypothetical protein L0P88_17445 [Muricauda sp. SCSIO 64092]|uniref:DUF1281 family ferredoxin-like fold protein n=1 Tax=Allomuricauda sp. SCSIO 64092 TaxID=2908842 RepID=UPI001FF3386A|nr:hypothetical protein [Muricauda sp. SCSIO 64092]UOY05721.1 hypothetical protein L0P88_17445 [Muricauda sp. SCSIO 64092]
MANHCYNYITINGNSTELNELYERLTKEQGYVDFKHVLGRKHEITYGEIFQVVGTKWFTPEIERVDDGIILSGDSAWSPPVALFKNLAEQFTSLQICMGFEESGMDFGGEIQINKNGVKEIFSGTFWQYRAHQDYFSFLEAATDEAKYLIDDGIISSLTDLKNLDIYTSLHEEDKEGFLKDVLKSTTKNLYQVQFKANEHVSESIFMDSEQDVKQLHPKAIVAQVT